MRERLPNLCLIVTEISSEVRHTPIFAESELRQIQSTTTFWFKEVLTVIFHAYISHSLKTGSLDLFNSPASILTPQSQQTEFVKTDCPSD